MTSELRGHFDQMTTAELVEVLRARDLKQWRPEVFPIIESILQERGIDVAALRAQPPDNGEATGQGSEPSPPMLEVMDLADPALLPVVKSLLEEGGFRFLIRNEGTQAKREVFGGPLDEVPGAEEEEKTTVLYRPVGRRELELIRESGFRLVVRSTGSTGSAPKSWETSTRTFAASSNWWRNTMAFPMMLRSIRAGLIRAALP